MDPDRNAPAFVYRNRPELANDIEGLSGRNHSDVLGIAYAVCAQLHDGRLPIRTQ